MHSGLPPQMSKKHSAGIDVRADAAITSRSASASAATWSTYVLPCARSRSWTVAPIAAVGVTAAGAAAGSKSIMPCRHRASVSNVETRAPQNDRDRGLLTDRAAVGGTRPRRLI
eukprot:4748479-Prymnesium_polylepis.1